MNPTFDVAHYTYAFATIQVIATRVISRAARSGPDVANALPAQTALLRFW